jgi:hypothetical protein
MANKIVKVEKVDLDIQTTDQMVERIGQRLGHAYDELSGKPEAQAAIVAVWESVQQLQRVNAEKDMMLQVMKAAMDEAVQQRDFAVIDAKAWEATARGWEFDLKTWSNHGVEMAQEKLAGVIAIATDLPATDVARVLDDLLGEDEGIDEVARDEFLHSFMEFANALYTEQAYRAYADDEAEDED